MDFVAMQCSFMSFLGTFIDMAKRISYFALILIIGILFSLSSTFFFALVGTLLGAFHGAFLGQDRENGIIRRASVGARAGANISLQVFEYCLLLLRSGESVLGCLRYLSGHAKMGSLVGLEAYIDMSDVIGIILSGRISRESISPAMLRDIERRIYDNAMRFDEVENIFDNGGPNDLSEDSIAKIPKIIVTSDNNVDTCGERISCTVCLQDFEVGETVRSLPHCHHMFHIPCIDMWLIRHGSCPLCRRDL